MVSVSSERARWGVIGVGAIALAVGGVSTSRAEVGVEIELHNVSTGLDEYATLLGKTSEATSVPEWPLVKIETEMAGRVEIISGPLGRDRIKDVESILRKGAKLSNPHDSLKPTTLRALLSEFGTPVLAGGDVGLTWKTGKHALSLQVNALVGTSNIVAGRSLMECVLPRAGTTPWDVLKNYLCAHVNWWVTQTKFADVKEGLCLMPKASNLPAFIPVAAGTCRATAEGVTQAEIDALWVELMNWMTGKTFGKKYPEAARDRVLVEFRQDKLTMMLGTMMSQLNAYFDLAPTGRVTSVQSPSAADPAASQTVSQPTESAVQVPVGEVGSSPPADEAISDELQSSPLGIEYNQ